MADLQNNSDVISRISWVSVPDAAEQLGVPLREVRGLLDEGALVALRVGDPPVRSIPAEFLLADGTRLGAGHGPAVLPSLRGTVIQLRDAGLADEQIVQWLFEESDELGRSPISALRSGSIRAVRRAAQVLAL